MPPEEERATATSSMHKQLPLDDDRSRGSGYIRADRQTDTLITTLCTDDGGKVTKMHGATSYHLFIFNDKVHYENYMCKKC